MEEFKYIIVSREHWTEAELIKLTNDKAKWIFGD